MRIHTITVAVAAFLVLFFYSSWLFAGACPIRADRLEDITACLAPMRGTIGMRAPGPIAVSDKDHGQVIQAMHRGPILPPQVVPRTAVYPFSSPLVFGYAYHRSGTPLTNWWMMNYLMWLSH